MGIDIGCTLMVGLPYQQVIECEPFGESIETEEYSEWLWDNLSSASPYYDCPKEDRFWGVTVVDVDYTYSKPLEVSVLVEKIESAKIEFKNKTGLDGHLVISPNVW